MRLYEFEDLDEKRGPAPKKTNWKAGLAGVAALGSAYALSHHPTSQQEPTHQSQATLNQNQKILALTIWGEARNQGEEGMRAVGHVIKNRAEADDPKFGQGIKGVALAPKQFSAWNKHDPNARKMNAIDNLDPKSDDYQSWQQAQRIAVNILNGSDPDPTDGALYYHTTAVHPAWARHADPNVRIGSHVFYNDI